MNASPRFPPSGTALLLLVWVAGLVGVYFFGYNKLGLVQGGFLLLVHSLSLLRVPPSFWALMGERLWDVTAVVLLLASAWCVGLALLRLVRRAGRPDWLTHLFGIAIGVGLWSWFVLLAGMAGWIHRALYLWPAALSLGLVAWHGPWLWRQRRAVSLAVGHWSGWEWFVAGCLGLGLVLNLIPTFSPEIEYDSLEYHLGALAEYRKAGRIHFLPYNFYASMPSLTEMLYLWGITVGTTSAAKLLHTAFGAMTAVGVLALGQNLAGRSAGLLAAALFYLLPFVTNLGETARIDLATTFFAFLGGAALCRHREDEDGSGSWRWLAALGAGLALATKYTAGPVVLLPMLMLLAGGGWPGGTGGGRRVVRFLGGLVGFAAVALVPVAPWLMKNAIWTGNPVYPLANVVFGSPYWTEASDALFHSRHAPRFDSLADWAMLVRGAWHYSTREPFSSPILLLVVPLFALVRGTEPRWKFCLWVGGLMYLAWFAFTFRPWRFLFPALPWLALAGALAVEVLQRERASRMWLRASLGVLLLFNLNFSFLLSAVDVAQPDRIPPQMSRLTVFFGQTPAREYLCNVYYTLACALDEMLPASATVLYVGEARIYYARHRVLANTVYDRSIVGELVEGADSVETVWARMVGRGITHVYVNQDELNRLGRNYGYLRQMNWALFQEFLDRKTTVVFRNRAHTVYALRPAA